MQHMRRWWYVWSWRARFFWHDTEGGVWARTTCFAIGVLATVMQVTKMIVVGYLQAVDPAAPKKAMVWWVLQLIIALVSAAVSYLLRPKPKPQPEPKHEPPVTDDGAAVREVYGTRVIKGQYLLAWKVMGKTAIKTKAGKK